MENDNYYTGSHLNNDIYECQIKCQTDRKCSFVKSVQKAQTCEMFTKPNKVCVGYLGLSDSILKTCGKKDV